MTQSRQNLIGWLAFSGLHLINALFHRMWADELQAWGLIMASHDLPDLHMRLNNDGHPALWYLALWPFGYLTSNPVALQVVSGIATVAFLGLLWNRSPFSLPEKLLLSLSFQLGYNLSVVCRSYVLGSLLVFGFVTLLPTYRRHPWLAWSVLAALANVQLYCASLSFCLALGYIHYTQPEDRPVRGLPIYLLGLYYCISTALANWDWILRRFLHVDFPLVETVPPLIIGIVIWLFACQSIPPKVRMWLVPAVTGTGLILLNSIFEQAKPDHIKHWGRSISALGRGVVPIVNPLQPDYWHMGLPVIVGIALAVVMLFVVGSYFRKAPFIVGLLGLQASFMLIVFTDLLSGKIWHGGILFMGIFGFVWMARHFQLQTGSARLLLLILIPQALVGANAMLRSKFTPLSNCHATARWIQKEGLNTEHVYGEPVFPTLGVAVYLEEKLFFPGAQKKVAHSLWRRSPKTPTAANRIVRRMRKQNLKRAYLVTPTYEKDKFVKALEAKGELRCTERYRSSGALRGEFVVLELETTPTADPEF